MLSRYDYSIVTEKAKSTKYLTKTYKDKVHYLLYGTRRTPITLLPYVINKFFIKFYLFIKIKPDVVVSTGTHTAVSMCYVTKIFRKKLFGLKLFTNRNAGTLAGKLVYPIADKFVVQWKRNARFIQKFLLFWKHILIMFN